MFYKSRVKRGPGKHVHGAKIRRLWNERFLEPLARILFWRTKWDSQTNLASDIDDASLHLTLAVKINKKNYFWKLISEWINGWIDDEIGSSRVASVKKSWQLLRLEASWLSYFPSLHKTSRDPTSTHTTQWKELAHSRSSEPGFWKISQWRNLTRPFKTPPVNPFRILLTLASPICLLRSMAEFQL